MREVNKELAFKIKKWVMVAMDLKEIEEKRENGLLRGSNQRKKISIRTKIMILGDGVVGNTSIVRRYLGWGFSETVLPTIGANYYTQEVKFTFNGRPFTIKWTIWDVAGQPAFKEVRDKYYLGAQGAILVFDLSRKKTLINTTRWVYEFFEVTDAKLPIVLVGNKLDLRGTERGEIPFKMGSSFARKLSKRFGQHIPYLEVSAKTNQHIHQPFRVLAKKILKSQ